MRLRIWACCALLFVGCQNRPNTLPYPLVISQEGMGAVHLGEPFDVAQLQGKLPGFELEKLSQVTSEKGAGTVRLKRGDDPVALIVSDPKGANLSQIIVLSPLVKNAQGLGLNDVLPLSKNLTCTDNQCRYDDQPSVHYTIDPDSRIIREIILQPL